MTETAGPEPPVSPSRAETPYVGLVPYGEEDAGFFFGRDEERRIVAANLRASRLTILYGPSGVGKTSLLQAGVVHDLREEALADARARPEREPVAICSFRDWRDDPLPRLLDAIQDSICSALGQESRARWQRGKPVVRSLHAWTRHVRMVLVVLDQFEDYFLYHANEAGDGSFADSFPAVVNEPDLRIHVLVSIREDSWAKLDLFEGRIPRLFGNYLRVDHLTTAGAREAIQRPVEEWNSRLEPGAERYVVEPALVDAVIDAAGSGVLALAQGDRGTEAEARSAEEIEAPYLQLVMDRLWRATVEAGSHELTLARLEQLGGPQQIVENHLLEALEGLTPSERAVAADVFLFLVTRSKTKISHSASDLAEWTKRPESEVSAVLDKLTRPEGGRILRTVSTSGAEIDVRYELFHDLLAEPILDWRRTYEEERARRAALRKFARVGSVLVALVAVFAALGIWALVQRGEARSASRSATSLALASDARQELGRHVDVSVLLGFQAYRASPSPQAASTMVAALEKARRSGAEAILRAYPAGGVRAIAFSPDGVTLATANSANAIQLWDVSRRAPLGKPLEGHNDEIWSLAFSPDGTTLASASHDGSVRLWSVKSQTPRGLLPIGKAGVITSVAFSPDRKTLAFGGAGGRLELWDVRARRRIRRLRGHTNRVVGLAFSPDRSMLASASYDGSVRLWDARTGVPLRRPLLGHTGRVLSVAFSPDGRMLASSISDGTVRLWRIPSGKPLGVIEGKSGEIWSVVFSTDGRTLASSGFDGTVRLWNVRTRRPLRTPLTGHTRGVVSLAVSSDGHTLASASYDGTVRLWDLRSRGLDTLVGRHAARVTGVAFAPDGGPLVSGGYDGRLRLWGVRARRALGQLDGDTGSSESVAVSPDGTTVASAGDDGSIVLVDVRKRVVRMRLRGHEGVVRSVAYSPDGRTLATAGDDGTVRLWDARTGKERDEPLRGHKGQITDVAFSPDGRMLASAGFDHTVRLWDVRSRTQTGQFPLRGTSPLSIAFSPDGRTVASGQVDGSVRLWAVGAREPIGEPLVGGDENVESVAWSPDGKILASASDDGAVRLWDVQGHQPLGAPLRGHKGPVLRVAFSPDGKLLATGGDDGTVRLWEGMLWRNVADLRTQVCRLVVGDLARSEWSAVAPGLAYRATCPHRP